MERGLCQKLAEVVQIAVLPARSRRVLRVFGDEVPIVFQVKRLAGFAHPVGRAFFAEAVPEGVGAVVGRESVDREDTYGYPEVAVERRQSGTAEVFEYR